MVNAYGLTEAASWDRAELEREAAERYAVLAERKRAELEWSEYGVLPYTADAAIVSALDWAACWRRAGARGDAVRALGWARRERVARGRVGLGFSAYMAAERGR